MLTPQHLVNPMPINTPMEINQAGHLSNPRGRRSRPGKIRGEIQAIIAVQMLLAAGRYFAE